MRRSQRIKSNYFLWGLLLFLGGIIAGLIYSLYFRFYSKESVEDLITQMKILRMKKESDLLIQHFPDGEKRASLPKFSRTSSFHREVVRNASLRAFSEEGLKRIIKDNVRIVFAPKRILRTLLDANVQPGTHWIQDGHYDPSTNIIFLNDHYLDDIQEKIKSLEKILSNEMSTAFSRATKIKKIRHKIDMNNINTQTASRFTVPWETEEEFKKINSAYESYERKIKYYSNLSKIPNKKRSEEEKKNSKKLDRALKTFSPMQWGKEKESVVIGNPPPASKIKQLKKWNRYAFFTEYNHHRSTNYNPEWKKYINKDVELIEKISDFDMLPSKLQTLLGNELCEELDKIHLLSPGQYCSRYKR